MLNVVSSYKGFKFDTAKLQTFFESTFRHCLKILQTKLHLFYLFSTKYKYSLNFFYFMILDILNFAVKIGAFLCVCAHSQFFIDE